MSDAYAKAIRDTQASVPVIRLGTIVTNLASPSTGTYATLDNDPTSVAVKVLSLTGPLPVDTRVALIAYPPNGLIVIGRQDADGNFSHLRLSSTGDASLSSTDHAFQIGPTSGTNLISDNNEIMVRNNGAAGSMFLQNDGGFLGIGTGAATGNVQIGPTASSNLNLNFNQVWALNNGADSPLFLNFSSSGSVQIGDGTTTGAGLLTFRNRARVYTNLTPTLTTTASFVNLDGTNGISFPYCPSGVYVVHIRAAITNSTVGNGQVFTFNIRDTNSGGTPRFTGGDDDSLVIRQQVVAAGQIYGGVSIYVTGMPTTGQGFLQPTDRMITAGSTTSGARVQYIIQPQT